MDRIIKLLIVVFFLILSSSFLYEKEVHAGAFKCGIGVASEYNGSTFVCGDDTSGNRDEQVNNINNYIKYVAISVASLSVGFAVAMIVYGGFIYTTSGGDAKLIQKAKQTIMQAGIGIFIALFSFVIMGIIKQIAGV